MSALYLTAQVSQTNTVYLMMLCVFIHKRFVKNMQLINMKKVDGLSFTNIMLIKMKLVVSCLKMKVMC